MYGKSITPGTVHTVNTLLLSQTKSYGKLNLTMNTMDIKNLFKSIPEGHGREIFETLLEAEGFRLERIVSEGQTTPAGEWYDQDRDEWVILLTGNAGIVFEGNYHIYPLKPGDYLHIPAHRRHRVEWTAKNQKTIWLAIHFKGQADTDSDS